MADTIINYYDELGLDRNAPIGEIQDGLRTLKLQLANKVARPGSQQEKWRHQLELVANAEETFKDQDSRERYDIELRRAGTNPAESQDIDWTTRAWNYYFIGDNGAAFVAARKAKEQEPESPMPFVVSAWVQLRDMEWKQAKQDADEAFVLDELTADSVDVQLVRGVAYRCVGDHERALMSFDRALIKAAEGEKPEIHFQQAVTHAAMAADKAKRESRFDESVTPHDSPTLKDWQASYDSGIKGLTVAVEMTDSIRDNLEKVVSDAINNLDNISVERGTNLDPAEAIKKYTAHSSAVASQPIAPSSKARIQENIARNIARCERLNALRTEVAELRAIELPSGPRPTPSCAAMGAAVVGFFIMIGAFQVSGGAGFILLLIEAAIVGFVIRGFSQRSQWDEQEAKFQEAQPKLLNAEELLNAPPGLVEPIWL